MCVLTKDFMKTVHFTMDIDQYSVEHIDEIHLKYHINTFDYPYAKVYQLAFQSNPYQKRIEENPLPRFATLLRIVASRQQSAYEDDSRLAWTLRYEYDGKYLQPR